MNGPRIIRRQQKSAVCKSKRRAKAGKINGAAVFICLFILAAQYFYHRRIFLLLRLCFGPLLTRRLFLFLLLFFREPFILFSLMGVCLFWLANDIILAAVILFISENILGGLHFFSFSFNFSARQYFPISLSCRLKPILGSVWKVKTQDPFPLIIVTIASLLETRIHHQEISQGWLVTYQITNGMLDI